MSWYYYPKGPSVAERRRTTEKKMEKLGKGGETIQPVKPFKTRTIATSFWGKAWCWHLKIFSDYENRLPRGRSYVRNGSVCHLAIEEKTVTAMVSGSELYKLSIHIEPLAPEKWDEIKTRIRRKSASTATAPTGPICANMLPPSCTESACGWTPNLNCFSNCAE